MTIFINDSNKNLTKLIERAQRHSSQAVESIKSRYREHIGFTAFMINQNKAEDSLRETEGQEISRELVNKIKQADLNNACEAICDIIKDFFQIIITESKEE